VEPYHVLHAHTQRWDEDESDSTSPLHLQSAPCWWWRRSSLDCLLCRVPTRQIRGAYPLGPRKSTSKDLVALDTTTTSWRRPQGRGPDPFLMRTSQPYVTRMLWLDRTHRRLHQAHLRLHIKNQVHNRLCKIKHWIHK
jgi:hypothetical protein